MVKLSMNAGRVEEKVGELGDSLITADHGNAEQMLDPVTGGLYAHTTNPVPLIRFPF